jgi:non-specific serine/threonine protein kinase
MISPGDQISHFRIVEKIGGGGMGVVYLAEDVRLGRQVALKFLPPHLTTDEEARRRFVYEAQAASSLHHTGICTILDIGQGDDERMWIAMPHYDGQSLRAVLSAGSIPVDQALEIAGSVAEALSAAHQKGVLHRDIKPGNIQITAGGRPVVLDFGLAKLAGSADLTVTGSIVGTVAYMSPEQIRGESLGPASDVWSLGVVLYEMLTGVKPFGADYEQAMIYAILNVEHRSASGLRPGIPESAVAVLSRALQKDPSRRLAKMSEFADIVRGSTSTSVSSVFGSGSVSSLSAQRLAGGSTVSTDPAEGSPSDQSVAVLPFSDMSPAGDQEYFCQGVAEEILGALSRVPGLRTASRMSTARFAEGASDVREIGAALGVRSVLEGSVRKAGNRVRVSVQLIDIEDGYQTWSERFDRELNDIFAIQDEIALSVAKSLEIALSPAAEREVQFKATADAEAYDLCLKGWRQFHRFSRKNTLLALDFFRRATELDDRYARAWAGLATCYSFMHTFFDSKSGHAEKSEACSRRAVEIDPDLAEARASRGMAFAAKRDYGAAEAELREAIRRDPELFQAWWLVARVYTAQGKYHEAAAHYARASELNPEDYQTLLSASSLYRAVGDIERAEAYALRGIAAAERQIEHSPDDTRAMYYGANGCVDVGLVEKGKEWVERALELEPDAGPVKYNSACFYALLGDTERALELLESAFALTLNSIGNRDWLLNDPDFESIRDHPRFQAIIDQLGSAS